RTRRSTPRKPLSTASSWTRRRFCPRPNRPKKKRRRKRARTRRKKRRRNPRKRPSNSNAYPALRGQQRARAPPQIGHALGLKPGVPLEPRRIARRGVRHGDKIRPVLAPRAHGLREARLPPIAQIVRVRVLA